MDRDEPRLIVAQVVSCTEAEGPGVGFALWLQGCPLRCPGCCNPEMLTFEGGTPLTAAEGLAPVEGAARARGGTGLGRGAAAPREPRFEGLAVRGGGPRAHAAVAAPLARELRARGL